MRCHKSHTCSRRILPIALLFVLLLFSASGVLAAEIVVVKSGGIKPYNEALEGFKSAYDCVITEINLSGSERQDVTGKIAELAPDAVLAIGTDAFRAVRSIKDLPVFYTMMLPSESLGSSSKNVSGVSMLISPELYLDTIAGIFPSARRVGLIYDPRNMGGFVRAAMKVAQAKGVELIVKEANRSRDVPAVIDMLRDRIDVFWMLPDPTIINGETVNYLLLFSFQNNIPILTFSNKYVDMGALAALNVNPFDLGVQTGEIARAVLTGKSSRNPVRVDARKASLTINRKVAKKLGIKINDENSQEVENR
ncbi:MAG: ABC transporter substrate-binding protein [Nitrospirota bacterium]